MRVLLVLDKKPSWSCGLCINDSLGHRPSLLPHQLHPNVGVHEAEETGKEVARGGRRWGGGACRFVIIPKQMLLLKSL